MRTKYATLNFIFGIINQILIGVINLILRKILIITLGIEYTGIAGLFANVLALLNLAESGFGTAIVFNLYKPIAEKDTKQIAKLMHFYKKVYTYIAIIVFIFGCATIPFLKYIISDTSLPMMEIIVYFILYLLNTVVTYFLSYKTSFIMAMQRQYIVVIVNVVIQIISGTINAISLIVFKNYIIYICINILTTLACNVSVSYIVDKKYKFIAQESGEITDYEKQSIVKNVKALFLHKVGAYVLNSTDYIVMSAFTGLVSVGMYSNYVTIVAMLNQCITQFYNAIVPGVGEIIAEDSINNTNNSYKMYKLLYFISFLLFGFTSANLFSLVQPFITLWVGSEYQLSTYIVIVIVANYYFCGMRNAPNSIKNAAGIYRQDVLSPVGESLSNLILSIILTIKFGMIGVLLGTLISGLFFPFWTAPYFLYKELFKKNFGEYFLDSIKYFIITLLAIVINQICLSKITILNIFICFCVKVLISLLITLIYFGIVIICLPEKKYINFYVKKVVNIVKKYKAS